MLGNLGHISVIIAIVSITAAGVAYIAGNQSIDETEKRQWLRFARTSFVLHGAAVFSTVVTLFSIIYFHHYEYAYAWKHSSNDLPVYFMISCFWEGQEGSFLLWIFWNVLIGLILIRSAKNWEFTTMAVFCTIQLFLLSMILGSHITETIKIGSSPFMLLKNVVDSEIFKLNPGFVPEDGTGLNPLLQNIWMVIHPPVIFLGFALTGVPFAYAMAALWQNRPEGFVKRAGSWVLASVGILGAGIMMGAYWAYETLNFGGYWNWDPVENAILIPWLVLLAGTHGIVLYRRKRKGLLLTISLIVAGFILILYSTFLTRSGILGDSSVHSFTDLGLSGQLLIFLVFFAVAGIAMIIYRRKTLADTAQNPSFLTFEFWMILGICLFCLSAFQVLLPTSFPVFNTIFESIGVDHTLATPVDQVAFYSKFQIWFAVAFCLAGALGQVFYWKKITSKKMLEHEMILPFTVTFIISSFMIFLGKTVDVSHICLITSAIYLIVVGIQLLFLIIKNIKRTSLGGVLAHVGMAVMLLGFVYSAGHKKVLSKNLVINSEESGLPAHTFRENLLLSRNVPKLNNDYSITYRGAYYQSILSGDYIPADYLFPTFVENKKILTQPFRTQTHEWIGYGDTVEVNSQNIYYSIEISGENGNWFSVMPRMQNNPTMGFIASPDIKSYLTKDIYTHITNFPDPEKITWNDPVTKTISLGEEFEIEGLLIRLESVSVNENPLGILTSPHDLPLEAKVEVTDQYASYIARPVFHIDQHRAVRIIPDHIKALGVKIALSSIDPESQLYGLSVFTSQRDWITLTSIEMPMIILVWAGSLILISGIGVSFYFRTIETRETRLNIQVDPEIYERPTDCGEQTISRKSTVNI